uniref:Peptidase_M23 domain-containing protein n=1 Tax=Globodera pallida TaxID=36090 RepID=A0A183CF77_GLOPA
MIQKLPMFILPICALLLYADAMPKLTRTLTPRKRTSALLPDEVTKMFEKPTKPSKKVAKKTVEVTGASSGHHADNVRPKVNIGQHVEQPGTPQIEEHAHAVASTSESMDPKSQLEELLEMDEALMWEMAVRSEDEQITMSVRPEDLLIADLEDEPITDLEDEPITNLENEPITNLENEPITDLEVEQIIEEIQLEDELITDLEDDTEDDDLLQWFPTFIFMKLEKFLPNVPQGDGQHKAELTKLVESWKAETEQTAQIEQIEDSLDTYRWELRNRIMPGVKLTSPVVKLLVAQGINNSHAEEKKAFLNKMPTSYANKFFGGIEIATAYLKQAVEIGKWAQNNHFLTSAQLENLPKLREKAKINDAQIAAVHLLTALRAASAEVDALSVEQSVDIEHETVHVKEIENSLDTYSEELRKSIMTDVSNVTPAVLSTLLDQGIFDSHAEEKYAFLWKIVIQKPTRYVKNVGQFFGGIEIATAYLKQAVEIGQWAQNNHFLTSAQLENLPNLVEQNLSELANLRQAMAAKLGINLAKIEMPKLTSLDNIFTRNLSEKHAETKGIAQREKAKINDAQIAAVHLLTTLRAASAEVDALSVEQSVDIEHETVHVKEIENSLDTYSEELRKSIMTDVDNVTPAVLSTLLDQGIFDSHAEAKNAFLWKIVIQKPTHFVKNVGQFFGGIEIATAYLKQAVEIGQWAQNNHFLTTAQLENLPKLVEQNLSKLANLREAMAAKLDIDLAKLDIDLTKDIDLAKIEMPELMAQSSPSLDNIFTSNLSEKHAETKGIAQREETKINDAQIAALHLLVALSAASAEVAALEAELLGIKITWRAFQTVGDVSKMAQILRQI